MDKTALRQLFGAGNWTVAELEERNPALAVKVATLLPTRRPSPTSSRPLSSEPAIAKQLARAHAYTISDVAGLDDAAADRVSGDTPALHAAAP